MTNKGEATTTANTDEYFTTQVSDSNYSDNDGTYEDKNSIKERFYNFLYDFERSKWHEYFYLKTFGGAILGAFISFVYINCVLYRTFSDHDSFLYWLTFGSVLFLATTSCMISMRARCIALLCFPTLFGGVGRRIYKAMLLAWVLAGPVYNLISHVRQSVASMTCMSSMHANQLRKIYFLIHAPITGGYLKGAADVSGQDNEYNKLKEKFEEMMQFILDEATTNQQGIDAFKENKEALAKVEVGTLLQQKTIQKCEDLVNRAYNACKKAIDDAVDRCLDAMPFFLDWTCYVAHAGKLGCVFSDWLAGSLCVLDLHANEINTKWRDLLSNQQQIEEDTVKAQRNWDVSEQSEKELLRTAEELNRRVTIFASYLYEVFEILLSVAEELTALIVFYIVIAAMLYLRNWEKNLDFDNYYITSYFVRKDAERRLEGKRSLLPLKRLEKLQVATTFAFKMTFKEKQQILVKLVSYTIEAFVVTLLFVADVIIYRVFLELSKHAEVKTQISGEHKLEVTVEGEGRVAKMLRNSFEPFRDNYFTLNITEDNAGCLPVANQISNEVIARVAVGYTVLYISLFFEVYILRFRHVIAAFVYRKHEKQRIIYLYSSLMKKRANGLSESKRAIEKLAVDYYLEQKYSYGLYLREKYAGSKFMIKLFDFLGLANHKCIVCDESAHEELPLVFCQPTENNFGCNLPYCAICWTELEGKCWACQYDKNDTATETAHENQLTEHTETHG